MHPSTTLKGNTVFATETEKLLQQAQDIARRAFVDPSETAVMDVFHELCAERDRFSCADGEREGVTLH